MYFSPVDRNWPHIRRPIESPNVRHFSSYPSSQSHLMDFGLPPFFYIIQMGWRWNYPTSCHICPLFNAILKISDDTVVKICESFDLARSESLAMDLVRAKTSIAVRRIIRRPFRKKGYDLIVMDLIPNAKQLHTCWHSLSFLAKLTARFYLRQLHCIRAAPLALLVPLSTAC